MQLFRDAKSTEHIINQFVGYCFGLLIGDYIGLSPSCKIVGDCQNISIPLAVSMEGAKNVRSHHLHWVTTPDIL